jgi:thioredoxin-dependent peroxiredoxin
MLQTGDKAPYFEGVDQDGNILKLTDLIKESQLVLYFYPKDSTPGCTAEACDLRDNYNRFIEKGYKIVGVSKDSQKSHMKFAEKFSLPFPLITDPQATIIKAYESWGVKKFMGKESTGTLRKTFIINKNGIIEDIIEKVDTKAPTKQIIG